MIAGEARPFVHIENSSRLSRLVLLSVRLSGLFPHKLSNSRCPSPPHPPRLIARRTRTVSEYRSSIRRHVFRFFFSRLFVSSSCDVLLDDAPNDEPNDGPNKSWRVIFLPGAW